MNKVYKLVWSKVRNCYVAVSELAKSRTKAPKTKFISSSVVASVLAGMLTFGITVPGFAAVEIEKYGARPYPLASEAGVVFSQGSDTNLFLLELANQVNMPLENFMTFTNNASFNFVYDTKNKRIAIASNNIDGSSYVVNFAGSYYGRQAVTNVSDFHLFTSVNYDTYYASSGGTDYWADGRGTPGLNIGIANSAKTNNTFVVGVGNTVPGMFSVVVGGNNQASGAIVYGLNNASSGGVIVGRNNSDDGKYAVMLGDNLSATDGASGAIIIGSNSKASGGNHLSGDGISDDTIVIGNRASAIKGGTGRVGFSGNEGLYEDAVALPSVYQAIAIGTESSVSDAYAISIGTGARAIGLESVSLGSMSSATDWGSLAVGRNASSAGNFSSAFGYEAAANGYQSLALGYAAQAASSDVPADIVNYYPFGPLQAAVAVGASSSALANNAVALGASASAGGVNSTALGAGSIASGVNSVALGTGSIADVDNVVAVGDRRIINVVDGVDDSDVATVGQLKKIGGGKTYNSGTGITIDTDDNIHVKNVLMYDSDSNDTASMSGVSGTKLTNLKAATLSNTSTDAVTGSQLYATNKNIEGFAGDIKKNKDNITNLNASVTAALETVSVTSTLVNTIDNLKADASLNNLTAAGHQVISTAAANAVQEYMAKHHGSAGTNSNVNTSLRTMNSLNRSVDPVSMSLMSVNPAPADTNYVVYDDAQASQVTLEGPIGTGTKITNVAPGDLSAASMDAVNGAQLYEVTQHFDDFQSALSSNNTSIAIAQTDINKMKTNHIQLESDVNTLKTEMETGFNVTVDGAKVKTVNPSDNYVDFVAGDGIKIEDANGSVKFSVDPEAIGGVTKEDLDKKADLAYVDEQLGLKADVSSVYTKTETDGLLAGKADVSYVDAEIGSVRTALGGKADKASVYTKTETDGLLVGKADKSYVDDGLALKADKDSVYTKVEANDLFVGKDVIKEALDKKADVDASNIDVNAWSEKLGTGSVEEGNTGLVNGGAVYDAIRKVGGTDMIAADYDAGSVRIAGNSKYDSFDVVDISKSDGSGRVLTGVATNPEDKTSAANVGYVEAVGQNIANAVNDRFTRMDDKVNKVGANAAALAALTPASFEGDEKWSLAASVGNYRSATAGAVGAFYKPQENVMINVRGSFGNNENMIAGGVAVALNKGDVPGVTKRQLARAVNAQAATIQNLQAEREADKAAIAGQADEIAELKAQVAEMAKALKVQKASE